MANEAKTNYPELMTIPALAKRSGVGVRRLRRAVRSGELPAYTADSGWPRVMWSEFLDWVRSKRVEPGTGPRGGKK